MRKFRAFLGLILIILLAACQGLPIEFPWLKDETSTPTLSPGEIIEGTATPVMTTTEETTPEPITSLTLWVPPEMNPDLETEASQLFNNRLQLFSDFNENIEINVRVKATSGLGGLLDALTATNAAAPNALPDLIALSRPDLEIAALKSIIFPLDGLTEIPDDSDWHSFTREMALLGGSTYGLPFSADALVLVYRDGILEGAPTSWTELFESGIGLAFPGESDQALFQMSLYLAAGGSLQDNQRRPMLQVEPLTQTFRLFQQGLETGSISEDSSGYQTSAQVWTAFREGQSNMAVTWLSSYLKDTPADALLMPLLPVDTTPVSLGTGMSWALATPDTNRHPLAAALAEFLVEPEFLAKWTAAAGYLPTRPTSLENWPDQTLQPTLNQVAIMTRLRPPNDVITSLGGILRDQTRQVLQGLVDPSQAAQVAVESLEE